MGKEAELLRAVKSKDMNKIQKLLVPEKGYHIQKVTHASPGGIPGGRIRMKIVHLDINCQDPETGYTPLIVAVLNGERDIVETLLFYSASVNVQDFKGNTPLHMAVWTGRMDIIHMLMKDCAEINTVNSDGDSPLHIVCRTDIENRVMVINTLLRASADVSQRNKNGQMPIDIAAMFCKKDAVSALLDHAPYLATTTSAVVEASIRGYKDVVHLLLDFGVNPNSIDKDKQTCALHEATRFARFEVAEILCKYGARSDVENGMKETPVRISSNLPGSLGEKFRNLFDASGPTETPRFLVMDPLKSPKPEVKDYPLLPTISKWTDNSLEFCNECTAENPNTNILDGKLDTFWIIPAISQAWTILDLMYEHILTGINIYGWDSEQMVKQFELQKAESVKGPWITVKTFYCERKGSSDPLESGVVQEYNDFTDQSRYWRINILSNHGGNYTCFQALSLCGADCRIVEMLTKLKLSKYTDNFLLKGYNSYRKFLRISKTEIENMIEDNEDQHLIFNEILNKRMQEFPLTTLKWIQPPPYSCKEGQILPDIIVKGDAGSIGKVEIVIEGEVSEAPLSGTAVVDLMYEKDNDIPTATFSNVSVSKAGAYQIIVQSTNDRNIIIRAPSLIEIKPKNTLTVEMEKTFQDMQAMLQGLQDSLELPT